MRALCWNRVNDLRVETVADPVIVNPHDAILRVTMSTTCGSDLHSIDGYIPTMRQGDVIGHKFIGEVVEVGREVKKVTKGERVVVPSFIVCGQYWYCQHELYSLCDNTNPKPELQEPLFGYPMLQGPGQAAGRADALPVRRRADRPYGGRLLPLPAGRHRRRLGV